MVKNDFNSLKKYIEVALILVGISIIPIFIYTVIKEYPIDYELIMLDEGYRVKQSKKLEKSLIHFSKKDIKDMFGEPIKIISQQKELYYIGKENNYQYYLEIDFNWGNYVIKVKRKKLKIENEEITDNIKTPNAMISSKIEN